MLNRISGFIKKNLSTRIIIFTGLFIFLSSTIIGYYFFVSEKELLLDSLSKRMDLIHKIVKTTLYYHLMPFGDFNKFKSYYSEINQLEDIYKVRLIRGNAVARQFGWREDSKPMSDDERRALNGEEVTLIKKINGKTIMEKIEPLRAQKICINCHNVIEGEIQGAISISLEIDQLLSRINQRRRRFFIFLFVNTGIMLTVLFAILNKTILTPVNDLVRGFRSLSSGNLNAQLSEKGSDEMAMLRRSFNKMVKDLKAHSNALIQSEKLATIGSITAGIAHQINNPLAIIMVRVEHLMDKLKGDKRYEQELKKDLDVILRQLKNISNIIANLLTLSRKPSDHLIDIDIKKLVEETVEFIFSICGKKGIQIKFARDVSFSPVVRANRDDLQQVIFSLLFNAVDSIKEKGVKEGVIEINLNGNRNECLLSIKDNGIGIKNEYLDKIFEPFFTTKKPGEGTGLGLTICQNILKRLNGNIWVESKYGEGATFFVKIPIISGSDEYEFKDTNC